MKKVYFFAPIFALVVFSGFYASHVSGLKEREAEKKAAAESALRLKQEEELAARKAAMAEAIALAEQRKKEKDAREAREKADQDARQLAIDARDKAFRDREKSARQIERVRKEIEAEEAALARVASARREAGAEKAFLDEFVAKAQANVQALQTLLTKLNTPAPVAAAK